MRSVGGVFEEWPMGMKFHLHISKWFMNGVLAIMILLLRVEKANALASRIDRFLNWLTRRPEETILICSHGRTLRCMLTLIHQRPLHEMEAYHHHNTGLYRFTWQNGVYQTYLENDISHLEPILKHERAIPIVTVSYLNTQPFIELACNGTLPRMKLLLNWPTRPSALRQPAPVRQILSWSR